MIKLDNKGYVIRYPWQKISCSFTIIIFIVIIGVMATDINIASINKNLKMSFCMWLLLVDCFFLPVSYREIEFYYILPQIFQTSYVHLVNLAVHPNLHFLDPTFIFNVTKSVWFKEHNRHVLITCDEQGAVVGAAHAEWKNNGLLRLHSSHSRGRTEAQSRNHGDTANSYSLWWLIWCHKRKLLIFEMTPTKHSLFHELRKKDNGRGKMRNKKKEDRESELRERETERVERRNKEIIKEDGNVDNRRTRELDALVKAASIDKSKEVIGITWNLCS